MSPRPRHLHFILELKHILKMTSKHSFNLHKFGSMLIALIKRARFKYPRVWTAVFFFFLRLQQVCAVYSFGLPCMCACGWMFWMICMYMQPVWMLFFIVQWLGLQGVRHVVSVPLSSLSRTSEQVGWMPIVESKSSLVAPLRMATE